MSFVEFDYGSAGLTEAGLKKIGLLEKALYDRPNLKLEIEGYVDPAQDKEGLKKAELSRLVKTEKLKEMPDKGQAPVPLTDISISPPEYERYLTLAYKAAEFRKPRTALGFAKTLPLPEMEKLINDNITITDDDLTQLAARRAEVVRERLLQDGKSSRHVFLAKSPSLAPDKNEKLKDSRVEFKLK